MPTRLQKGKKYDIVDGDCEGLSGECVEVRESPFGHSWAVIATPNGPVTKREATVRLSEDQDEVQEQPGYTPKQLKDIALHNQQTRLMLSQAEQDAEDHANQDAQILGDPKHPATRDYVATNLLAHIDKMPNTGDWHGQLKSWAQANTSGNLVPNPQ